MKKIFQKDCIALAFCLFLSMNAFAYVNVTIDGISYSLDYSTRTATVTGSSLQDVVVPETIVSDDMTFTVTAIGTSAFITNYTIVSIKTGNTIKTIGDRAFEYARKLQKVDFGNALQSIGECAFGFCESLQYIVLPKSIEYIAYFKGHIDYSFRECDPTIICLNENISIRNVNNIIYPSSFFTFGNSTTCYNS